MDAQTYELNCTKLVGTYGDEIDRALRIEMERLENLAINMRNRHRAYEKRHGTTLPGMLRRIAEIGNEGGDLRTAREWLADARKPDADAEKAVWFVVVYGEPVYSALVRQEAADRVSYQELERLFDESSDGPGRKYIAGCAKFTAHQIEALADASNWFKRLNETEVVRDSAQR
ncbi:hypothetical protein [Streptomyces variabilis]